MGLAATAVAGLSLACTRESVLISSLQPTSTKTPFMPEYPTRTPNSTEQSKNVIPTATETPNPFLIEKLDFSKESQIGISFNLGESTFYTSFKLLPFTNRTPDKDVNQVLNGQFRPGNGTGLSVDEKYRNTILYLHSGYIKGAKDKYLPLQAEPIRSFIEGFDDQHTQNPGYYLPRLKSLEGQEVTINQDGVEQKFVIKATTRIPHAYIPLFLDIKNLDDIASNFGERNHEGFEYFKTNQGLLITFCGWGPEDSPQNSNSPDYRYTFTRYILGLTPMK